MKKNDSMVLYVLLAIGFIFLRSGYGKVSGGEFVGGLEKTLGFFASKNPYPFVKAFLISTAIPNSEIFGTLTMFGELVIAVSILIPIGYYLFKHSLIPIMLFLLGAGLVGALFLNGTFWLASGWTSPSTDSLNLLMVFVETIGLVFIIKEYKKAK